ncbi:MAG: glycosyltransferase family 4 protein [Paracoccaceae bacterium]
MTAPDLIVTNLNRRFTGVSATAAAVAREQAKTLDLRLAGHPLPGLPEPVSLREAIRLSRHPKPGRAFTIWHVRRNPEMQAAIIARDVLRLPIRIVFTSAAQRRHSAWPRWLISRMDRVIATTDEAAGFLKHVAAVIPHGVDTGTFRPATDRRAAWAASGFPGTAGIATVGRIRPEKGTDRFVDSAIRTLPGLPGVTALAIGQARGRDAGFLDRLRQRVAAAGLADRILFPGELPPERLAALLPGLSLLVALPRYEGYGVTPLEAMACAVPVVATEAGHFRAFVGQGEAGLIVEPDEAAGAVRALLADPARIETLGRSARRRVEAGFSVTGEAAAIGRVYEALWSGDLS